MLSLLNFTPRYFYSDLHVDISSGALASPVGGGDIWLLFASEHETLSDKVQNREMLLYDNWVCYTLKQYHHQDPAIFFEVSVGRIHTGYIGYTKANTAIYIPPGRLHCMYTLKGSYLGTFYIDSPAYSHNSAVIMTKELLALHTQRNKVTEKAQNWLLKYW